MKKLIFLLILLSAVVNSFSQATINTNPYEKAAEKLKSANEKLIRNNEKLKEFGGDPAERALCFDEQNRIINEAKKQLKDAAPKGEFEKDYDYRNRLRPYKDKIYGAEKKIKELEAETKSKSKYAKRYEEKAVALNEEIMYWEKLIAPSDTIYITEIGTYNSERETFDVKIMDRSFVVNIPITNAPEFKANFKTIPIYEYKLDFYTNQSNSWFKLYEFGTMNFQGQTSRTVRIGNQWWMIENLNIKTDYSLGIKLTEFYGLMYGIGIENYLRSRKSALNGFHIPSKEEWQELLDYYKYESFRKHPLLNGGVSGFNAIYYKPSYEKVKSGAHCNEYWSTTKTKYHNTPGYPNLDGSFVCEFSENVGPYINDMGNHRVNDLPQSYRVRLVKTAVQIKTEENNSTESTSANSGSESTKIKVIEKSSIVIIDGKNFRKNKIVGKTWLIDDLEFNGKSSYTYEEAKQIADQIEGYRIPTNAEWGKLLEYMGGEANKSTFKSFTRKNFFNATNDCGYWTNSNYKGQEEKKWVVGTWWKVVQRYAYKNSDKMRLRLVKE